MKPMSENVSNMKSESKKCLKHEVIEQRNVSNMKSQSKKILKLEVIEQKRFKHEVIKLKISNMKS